MDAPPRALHKVGLRQAVTPSDTATSARPPGRTSLTLRDDTTSARRSDSASLTLRDDTTSARRSDSASLTLRDDTTSARRSDSASLTLRDDTATPAASPDGTRLPGMSGVPVLPTREDLPLSTGAWVAHGGLTLLPLGGVWGATRVGGDTRLGATAAESAAGMLAGYLPSRLLFMRPVTPGAARWMDLEVAAFTGGLLFTPPLAALGTWGMGEVAFGRSQDQSDAYLGALGGAATGTLLAVAVDALLTEVAEPSTRLKSARSLIGLALIGTGATLGYQWAGGGPRANQHTR
ncbi:hypothetical protein [Myxococcus qinghaiensis]|uniref:hypothetical protein n=1 Tax=Myxococcus qinghaiensis TaxID=2906758 RepID=UPI0020A73767|nr:hypothetical protein [Myxococcus qinghaiensis]MCP3166196.1 hypothetical protein [Myxococcus qinghaiensis]